MIRENFKMAFQSLRASKLRSFLTMLGIIIGIAAVVSINAIGEGVKKSVSDQITGLGTNLITIMSGQSVASSSSGKRQTNFAGGLGISTLTQKDVTTIGATAGVKGVAPVSVISGLVSGEGKSAEGAMIVATTPAYDAIRQNKFTAGSFYTDAQATQSVIVLGSDAKTAMFGDADAIGKTVKVRTAEFKVVGVIKGADSSSSLGGGTSFDNAVFIPVEAGKKLSDNNYEILRILAQGTSSDEVKPAVDRIKTALKTNHGGQEDFSVLTQEDLLGTVNDILGLLTTFISAIAAIALLVGGVGIMNIMLVSVTERTREIGIRKALGATRSMILSQFLIEAIVLSLLGGILGVAAAFGMANIGGRIAKISPVFTMQSMALAVGVSVGIGVIFGFAPAVKAARKRPIDALKQV